MTKAPLAPDPRSHPASYPGGRPAFDYLLRGERVHPLPDDRALLLSGRQAVVAFGSNAAPTRLAAKFGRTAAGIPVTRARLHGFSVGHSPHVSVPGYVPWVLVDEPGSVVDVAVLWLDEAQRTRLDVTEPNYDLVPIDAARYPLVVDAIEVGFGYAAYRGRWGALRWPGEHRPTPATSQVELFTGLGRLRWFRELIGPGGLVERQRRLAGDRGLRDRVRDELVARAMVVPDGWATG